MPNRAIRKRLENASFRVLPKLAFPNNKQENKNKYSVSGIRVILLINTRALVGKTDFLNLRSQKMKPSQGHLLGKCYEPCSDLDQTFHKEQKAQINPNRFFS